MLLRVPFRKCLTRVFATGASFEVESLPGFDIPWGTGCESQWTVAEPFWCSNGQKGNGLGVFHIRKVLTEVEASIVHSLRAEAIEIV